MKFIGFNKYLLNMIYKPRDEYGKGVCGVKHKSLSSYPLRKWQFRTGLTYGASQNLYENKSESMVAILFLHCFLSHCHNYFNTLECVAVWLM